MRSFPTQKKILITAFTFPPQANGVSHVAWEHARGLAQAGYDVTVATGYDPARESDVFPDHLKVVQFDVSGNAIKGYRGDVADYQNYIAGFDGEAILCHCWQIWSTDLAIPAFALNRAKKILVSHGVSANSTHYFPRLAFSFDALRISKISRELNQIRSSVNNGKKPRGRLKTFTLVMYYVMRRLAYHSFLLRLAFAIRSWLAWRPYVWRMPQMMKAFDHVVFLADKVDLDRFYDRWLAQKLGLSNYSIIPNGASLMPQSSTTPDFRAAYGLDDAPIVLHVSNYELLKDQALALRAFVRAQTNQSVLVFIGGEINDYARQIQDQYEDYVSRGCSARVLFLEKLTPGMLAAAYHTADLFLCSSRTEAQPLVVLDAMAAGIPFISTNVGCVAQLPGGIIAQSPSEMTRHISGLLADGARRQHLGAVGRAAVAHYYNWEHVVTRYDNLLRSL